MILILFAIILNTIGTWAVALRDGVQIVGRDAALKSSYDFVIAGGGTAGLTLADRLTENPAGEWIILRIYKNYEQALNLPQKCLFWSSNMGIWMARKQISLCQVLRIVFHTRSISPVFLSAI